MRTIGKWALLWSAAFAATLVPALAQGPWRPGDKIWGKPYYEQWSECVITSAQTNNNVQGGMQYGARCQIISNGHYVPTDEVLTATMTRAFAAAPPAEASGAPHRVLARAPRAPLDCRQVPAGRPGTPDGAIVRGLIQCRLESAIAVGDTLIANPLSIRYLGNRPWRVGYAYRNMPGGQGGDFGGGGPGTTVYLFQVDDTVTNYSTSGVMTDVQHQIWECFFAQGRWSCGIGSR